VLVRETAGVVTGRPGVDLKRGGNGELRGTTTGWGLKRGRRNTESQRKKRAGSGDVGASEGGAVS
jgi:hypothetical protein